MSRFSFFSRVKRFADHFIRAEGGNVAPIFAIACLPILGFVGVAIDYTRVNNARTTMQAALDSTALMVSKDAPTLTPDQLTTRAKAYFTALYNSKEAPNANFSAAYTANTGAGSSVILTSSGTMKTEFLKVAGFPTIDFNVGSTAKWGNTKLRVALALDNTGSM